MITNEKIYTVEILKYIKNNLDQYIPQIKIDLSTFINKVAQNEYADEYADLFFYTKLDTTLQGIVNYEFVSDKNSLIIFKISSLTGHYISLMDDNQQRITMKYVKENIDLIKKISQESNAKFKKILYDFIDDRIGYIYQAYLTKDNIDYLIEKNEFLSLDDPRKQRNNF